MSNSGCLEIAAESIAASEIFARVVGALGELLQPHDSGQDAGGCVSAGARVKVPFSSVIEVGPRKSAVRLNNSSNRQNPCKHWHHNDSVFSANRFVPVRNSAIIWDVITPANAPNDRGLAVFGEFFLDLVLYDLPSVPRLGEEVKTTSFARFPGGGLATTALVASHLGTPTRIITIVGQDALPTREWQKLLQSGVSTRGCEFHPTLPTAMTVCAAFDGDRMMITYDKINRNLEALLSHKAAQAQIRSARHLHLACAMAPPGKWARLIRKLRHTGIGLSADLGWNPETLRSPQLPSLLRELEFTFPNESEAKAMTGERTVEAAARELARWVRVPVLKLGVDGCLAVADGKVLRKVDSGSLRGYDRFGDTFNGGFCMAIWRDGHWRLLRARQRVGTGCNQGGWIFAFPREKLGA
jgi:sugar/nucleoside kinase (ribokinase family)